MVADREELYWKQTTCANWLKFGDRNTNFFHKFTSNRRRTNKIKKLNAHDEQTFESEDDIKNIAMEYFQEIFSTQGEGDVAPVLGGIEQYITPSMNDFLLHNFTHEEVFAAVQSMSPLQASGEDGLGAIFYQHFCNISIAQSPLCPRCTQEIEDISHISRHCTFAQQILGSPYRLNDSVGSTSEA
ncbi:hypothetical protein GQ457_03G020140 [Hibiscus cannabinus]